MERVLGQASVDIRANDKMFLRDLKKMLKEIKDQKIDALLSIDTKQAEKELDKFNKSQSKNNSITLEVDASVSQAKKKVDDFKNDLAKKAGTLKFTSTVTFAQARRDIAAFKKEQESRKPITLKARMTFAQARKDIKDFAGNNPPVSLESSLALNTQDAQQTISDFRMNQMNGDTMLKLTATVGFGLARTQLAAFKKEVDGRKLHYLVDANTNPARKSVNRFIKELNTDPIYVPVHAVNADTGEINSIGGLDNLSAGQSGSGGINVPLRLEDEVFNDKMDALNKRIIEIREEGINFSPTINTNKFDREVERLNTKMRAYDLGMEILAKPKLSNADVTAVRRQIQRTFPELGDEMAGILSDKIRRGMRNSFSSGSISNLIAPEITKAMTGFGSAMTGVLPFDLVKDNLLEVVGGLEGLSANAGKTVTAVGALGASLTAAGGFAVNLATDLAQVVGIAGLMPAAFAANQIRVWTKEMAFSGMKTAIFSQNMRAVQEALAGMTPVMQHAAKYLRDFFNQIGNATQNAYWDQMGSEIQMTAEIIKGTLIKNFSRAGEVMALNHIEVLKQIVAFEKLGGLDLTFTNIVDSFENMREGMGLATKAILSLTAEGSKKLPELANHFTGLARSFDEFIQANINNGNILQWIDVAIQRIGELGLVVGDIVEIIGAIGQAAEIAGIGGLTEMVNVMEDLSEYVNSPIFKDVLINTFRSANIAAGELAQGLGHVWDGLIHSAPQVSQIFIAVSESIEDLLEGIGIMMTKTSMMDGFQKLAEGVRNALDQLHPAFESIGNIIGMFGEMGQVIIENLVPGINTAAKMVEVFLDGFKDGFIKLLPVLQEVASSFHHMLIEPIRLVGEALGGLMTAISNVPTSLLTIGTAFTMLAGPVMLSVKAFQFLRDAIKGVGYTGMIGPLGAVHQKISDIATDVKKVNFTELTTGLARVKSGTSEAFGGMKNAASTAANTISSVMLGTVGAIDSSRHATENAAKSSGGLSRAWSGTKESVLGSVGAIKGGVSSLGGVLSALGLSLPGLAIAGGLTLVTSAMASMQAGADQAKHSIEELGQAFANDNFEFGLNSLAQAKERMEELGKNWLTDWNLDNTFKEDVDKLGLSIDDLAGKFQGSKKEVTEYAGSWNHFATEISKSQVEINKLDGSMGSSNAQIKAYHDVIDRMSKQTLDGLQMSAQELKDLASRSPEAFRNMVEGMGQYGSEVLETVDKIKSLKEELTNISDLVPENVFKFAEDGGQSTEGLRTALRNANEQVGALSKNMEVLSEETATLDQKFGAFKENLRLTGAESFSNTGGLKEYYGNLSKITDGFDKVKAGAENGIKGLMEFESSGGKLAGTFKFQTQAARDFHDVLTINADNIQKVTVGAFDAALKSGKNYSEAIAIAQEKASGPIEDLKAKIREVGNVSEDEITAILDGLGLLPEDIKMGLDVSGADEAKRKIIETQVAAQAFISKDYTMVLEVMADDAKNELSNFLGLTREELKDPVKVNTALDDKGFNMNFDQLMQKIAMADDPMKIIAQLKDETGAPTEEIRNRIQQIRNDASDIPVKVVNQADTQIQQITKSLDDMVRDPRNVELTTNAKNAADQALAELKRLNKENPDLKLDADITKLEEQINNAKNSIDTLLDDNQKKVVIEAIDKATPAIGKWNDMVPNGKLAVLDMLDKATPQIQGFNAMTAEDKEAVISAIDEANPKAMAWQSLSLDEKKAVLSVHDEATTAVQNYNVGAELNTKYGGLLPQDDITQAVQNYNNLTFLDTKMGVLDVIDRATPAAGKWNQLPLNTKNAVMSAIDRATPVIEGYNAMPVEQKDAVLAAVDRATPAVNAWHQLTVPEKKAILAAQDNATPAVNAWNATVAQSKNGIFNGIDNANPILGTWNSTNPSVKTALLNAVDQASGVQAAFDANPIKDKTAYLTANSDQAHAVQQAFDSLPIEDKNSILTANNREALATQAEYDALPIQDKLSLLTSDATKALSTQRAFESIGMDNSNKEAQITANNEDARQKVNEADSWSIGDKFFNIAANLTSGARNILNGLGISFAVGGILPGNTGIKAFANGGIQLPDVSSFANGTERHVAQIARGQTPYRVWAEPETGGEAYIPLAKSKRKRSMKILEQVARYFGMNLMKYNNGGVYKGKTVSRGVTAFANGGTDIAESLSRDRQNIADAFRSLKAEMSGIFGSPAQTPVASSLESIEKTLREFATTYRKTAPDERAKALRAVSMIDAQQKLSRVWNGPMSQDFTADFMAKQARFNQTHQNKIPMARIWTLADVEKAIGILNKNLEKQSSILETRRNEYKSSMSGISSGLYNQFDIGSTLQSKDGTGWRPPTTASDINSYVQNMLSRMRTFKSRLSELSKAGYNAAIVNQIANMAPEDAIAIADALLKDKSHLKNINSGFTQMFGARGDMNIDSNGEAYVGGIARQIAKIASDNMFLSGIAAQEGLVKGLTSDVSALEKVARQMADTLTNAFKNAMGIRSPSRVMIQMGSFITEGLTLGIDKGRPLVTSSMSNLVRPSDMNITSRPSDYRPSATSGIIGGAQKAGPTINVYPSQGLSEEQIGQAASRELLYRSII